MTESLSVAKILSALVIDGTVSMSAVARIGEAITADARLSGFGEGKTIRENLDAIIEVTGAYENLQKRAMAAVSEFEEIRNESHLIEEISEIRDALIALY